MLPIWRRLRAFRRDRTLPLVALVIAASASAPARAGDIEVTVGPSSQPIVDGLVEPARIPDDVALRLLLRTVGNVSPGLGRRLLIEVGLQDQDLDMAMGVANDYKTAMASLDAKLAFSFEGSMPPDPDAIEAERFNALRTADAMLRSRLGEQSWVQMAELLLIVKEGIKVVPVYDPETPAGQTCEAMGWWRSDEFDTCYATCAEQCTRKQWCGSGPCDPWPHYCWKCPSSGGGGGGGTPGLTCGEMSWHYSYEFDDCTNACGEPCVRKQWCSSGPCQPWPHYCWKCRANGGGTGGGGAGNLYTYIQVAFDGERSWSVATAETDFGVTPQVRVSVETTIRDLVDSSSSVHGQIQGFPSATLELSIGATQAKAMEGPERDRFEVVHEFRLLIGETIIRWIRERFFERLGTSFICYRLVPETAGQPECGYSRIEPCTARCRHQSPAVMLIPRLPEPTLCPPYLLVGQAWVKAWGETLHCAPGGPFTYPPGCHCFDVRL